MKPQRNARGTPGTKPPSESEKKTTANRRFMETAMRRWKLSAESTSETRRESLDDFKFCVLSEQWPEAVRRKFGKKVILTINRVMAFVKQVTNEQRQQRPAGIINPVGDNSDKDTAEILQGLVRHVEVNCDAEVGDDIAFEHMVIGGFGWIRMWSEYVDDDPENEWAQEIKLGAVPNPFTVYDDPNARHPLKIDAKWRFFVEDMPIDDYKEQYGGKTDYASLEQFRSVGDSKQEWVSRETIRIAEYYHIEYKEETIFQLADGSTVRELAEGQNAIKTRIKQTPSVVRTIINAVQPLEEATVPGTVIPSWPVFGDTHNVNGKQYIAGLVRNAKDPARAYNYQLSKATQAVAIAPTMPFVIAEGQAEGHEAEWQNANTGDLAALTYKHIQGVERPERQTAEPPIQAISHLLTTADMDMKAVTGLFDPSLGQKTPDQSGKAIMALQKQGNVATANFSDNLARTKREVTRGLLQWIPVIYDAAAVRRIIKPDGSVDHVGVYNSKAGGMAGLSTEEAKAKALETLQEHIDSKKISKIYDIGVGRYDVVVNVGPSWTTKRQQAAAEIQQLVAAYPEMLHICGDLMVGEMDIPLAKEMAERLKRTIPPNVLGPDDGSDPAETLARTQAEMQQLMQQHDQATQIIQKQNEIITQKQIEAQSKKEVAQLQEAGKMEIVKLQTAAQVEVAGLNAKLDLAKIDFQKWEMQHQSAHDVGILAEEQAHEKDQAAQQQAAAAQSQTAEHAQQASMAQQAAENQTGENA